MVIGSDNIHLGHTLDPLTLELLAEFICGDDTARFPIYRSSSYLTRFFESIDINAVHDGSTRKWWVLGILKHLDPSDLEKVILRLTDLREYRGKKDQLALAVQSMNGILAMENLKIAFNVTKPVLQQADPIQITEEGLLEFIPPKDEEEFLGKQFGEEIKIAELGLDGTITPYLQERVDEIQVCPKEKVCLGTIFLLGSTLEGLLLAVAMKNPSKFMSSHSAPKEKNGKVKQIYCWKLSELIDVAFDVNLLELDVKKFSHVLRDFRNYIHPYQQMSQNFRPDQHTVGICWQVFKAAFEQLKKNSS